MRASNERKQIAESYYKVIEEMLGPPSIEPVAVEAPVEVEGCGGDESLNIAAIAAQAIAAITELATAAGASISVTVDVGEEELDRVNTGYEDAG